MPVNNRFGIPVCCRTVADGGRRKSIMRSVELLKQEISNSPDGSGYVKRRWLQILKGMKS